MKVTVEPRSDTSEMAAPVRHVRNGGPGQTSSEMVATVTVTLCCRSHITSLMVTVSVSLSYCECRRQWLLLLLSIFFQLYFYCGSAIAADFAWFM